MEEVTVSGELAMLAYDKGFDIPCREAYDSNTDWTVSAVHNTGNEFYYMKDFDPVTVGNKPHGYLQPTQSLLQKWLREKHFLHINIVPYFGSEYDTGVQFWELLSIVNLSTEQRVKVGLRYETYEGALEKGLKECLNTIDHV